MGYIAINNYTKKIKKRTVLDNINLTFDKGKIYGLVGKNGCGKTMLLRGICGFITASQGEIIIIILKSGMVNSLRLLELLLKTQNFITI